MEVTNTALDKSPHRTPTIAMRQTRSPGHSTSVIRKCGGGGRELTQPGKMARTLTTLYKGGIQLSGHRCVRPRTRRGVYSRGHSSGGSSGLELGPIKGHERRAPRPHSGSKGVRIISISTSVIRGHMQ